MTDGALREKFTGVGKDLHQAGTGAQHDAGAFALAPAADDGHSQQVLVEGDGLLKGFRARAAQCDVMDALDELRHGTFLLGKVWMDQRGGCRRRPQGLFVQFRRSKT